MRVSTSAFPDSFMLQTAKLQNQQSKLQNEASTGLKLSLPEDDPAAMAQVLDLQTLSDANSQYQTNITQLTTQATTTYNAINSLKSITNRLGEIATLADGASSPTAQASYATEVGQLIQQAVQIGNTQDADGNYIFGGTNTGSPPFVATTDSSGNVTGVTYQGNTSVAGAEVSAGMTVSAQTLGANTSGSGPAGLFVDSRSGADLFSHMISLQQNLQSGNTAAIASTDAPALTKDENNLLNQVSANGAVQSRLQAASSLAAQQGQAITSQISSKTDADLATTLTQFSQAQTAYQAALQSGVSVLQLSLLNYLH